MSDSPMKQDPAPEQEYTLWPAWFCQQPEHEFFCEVNVDYIEEWENVEDLAEQVPCYEEAVAMITGLDAEDENDDYVNGFYQHQHAAYLLYGLIHAKYILTEDGLNAMREKYLDECYGRCQNPNCERQLLLPVGLHDQQKLDGVKVFCVRCQRIMEPLEKQDESVDGAFFGTQFAQAFFEKYPDLLPH